MSRLNRKGALWLGEHHNSAKDHNLQVEIIRQLFRQNKNMAIGLEQVQQQFQPVLDDYINGNIKDEKELCGGVQWEQRWMWPFAVYQPIFQLARELGIPLIALNVNSEDLALVEKGGFPNFPKAISSRYITDPYGFADFAKPQSYNAYVNYVIRPSYQLHQDMGLLQYTMSGEKMEQPMSWANFFSGRILWDEAMANQAYQWTRANPDGLLIGLVGADHVKFRDGIPGRYQRLAAANTSSIKTCTSVLLNPTLIDTRPPGTVGMEGSVSNQPDSLTLQLRYLKEGVDRDSPERFLPSSTGGVLPLSDYILVS